MKLEEFECLNDEEKHLLLSMLRAIQLKKEGKQKTYIHSLLGLHEVEEDGEMVIKMPITPLLDNSLQIVHGGMTATLLDSTMGKLVFKTLLPHQLAVTQEMKINYTAPAVGQELICKASILHKGTKTILVEGKVYRDDDVLVAHSTATFFILEQNKIQNA